MAAAPGACWFMRGFDSKSPQDFATACDSFQAQQL
jgi:hypothetical protein